MRVRFNGRVFDAKQLNDDLIVLAPQHELEGTLKTDRVVWLSEVVVLKSTLCCHYCGLEVDGTFGPFGEPACVECGGS